MKPHITKHIKSVHHKSICVFRFLKPIFWKMSGGTWLCIVHICTMLISIRLYSTMHCILFEDYHVALLAKCALHWSAYLIALHFHIDYWAENDLQAICITWHYIALRETEVQCRTNRHAVQHQKSLWEVPFIPARGIFVCATIKRRRYYDNKDSDFEESIGAKMEREKNVIRLSNSIQRSRCQIDGKIQMSFLRGALKTHFRKKLG